MLFAIMNLCLSVLIISGTIVVGMSCAYICKEIKEDLKIR
jgi:hypothetical protein